MKTIDLLLFEDNPNYRDGLAELLRCSPGLCLKEAFSDADQLEPAIEKYRPDAILMDIDMPGGRDGIQACAKARELMPDCEVVMFTVFDDDDRVFEALKAGASGYLLKNATHEEIVSAIVQVRNGGSPMSSSVARRVIDYFRKKPASLGRSAAPTKSFNLSEREIEILEALSKGYRNKEIATKFFLSEETIRSHCRNIYRKLQVNSRVEAINKYFER